MDLSEFQVRNLRFGAAVSLLLAVITVITFGFAMMAVPPSGPYCVSDCMKYPYNGLLNYYPRDYYWMYLAIFQLFAFVLFLVTNHHLTSAENRLFSSLSLAFGMIAATVLLIAYFTQFSVVPVSVMKGETDGIALITQYNDHGLFIALEELGYICMAVSLFFLAYVFQGKGNLVLILKLMLKWQLLVNLIAFIFYAFHYGIHRSYRFEVATISINWLVLIAAGILTAVYYRKRTFDLTTK